MCQTLQLILLKILDLTYYCCLKVWTFAFSYYVKHQAARRLTKCDNCQLTLHEARLWAFMFFKWSSFFLHRLLDTKRRQIKPTAVDGAVNGFVWRVTRCRLMPMRYASGVEWTGQQQQQPMTSIAHRHRLRACRFCSVQIQRRSVGLQH